MDNVLRFGSPWLTSTALAGALGLASWGAAAGDWEVLPIAAQGTGCALDPFALAAPQLAAQFGIQAQGYRAFVQRCDEEPCNVLFFFDGGGACWNDATCVQSLLDPALASTFDPLITEAVAADGRLVDVRPDGNGGLTVNPLDATGVLSANPDNPFRDYTKVFLPYCTGDVFWGRAVTTYSGQTPAGPLQVPVLHGGFSNARAVLTAVAPELAAAEKVAFAGASAGAYGVLPALAYATETRPRLVKPRRQDVMVVADSGNGIVTDAFLDSAYRLSDHWGIGANPEFSNLIEAELIQGRELLSYRIYAALTNRYRRVRFGQYQSAGDQVQVSVYNTMKYPEDPARWTRGEDLLKSLFEWTGAMRLNVLLSASAPNYRFYNSRGYEHVVLVPASPAGELGFTSDDFSTQETKGSLFTEWLGAMESGNDPAWDNVTCFPGCLLPEN